jgi:hypothetical protein
MQALSGIVSVDLKPQCGQVSVLFNMTSPDIAQSAW